MDEEDLKGFLPSTINANMCSVMIVCVLLPRFQLTVAAGSRKELLRTPVALAPEPGGVQQVGEVSIAAETFGVHPGMRLGEALARCAWLTLVPPDPAGVAESWERLLVRLESIGAAVEPERPGLVCFDAQGLLRLHGRGTLATNDRERVGSVLEAARRALRVPARYGVAPSRFAAVAAATRARVRRPVIVPGGKREAGDFLVALPVALLRARPALAELPEALERLGIATLGELAALSPGVLADRFGTAGLLAHELANGGDGALRPRPASEFIRESLDLPEAASGISLERGLGLLIDRLIATAGAAGTDVQGGGAVGGAGRAGRNLARAGRVPRGARRPGADAVGAGPAPGSDARARRAAPVGGGALRTAHERSALAARGPGGGAGRHGFERRSARRARPLAPMPQCACSRSIPARASPSAGRC